MREPSEINVPVQEPTVTPDSPAEPTLSTEQLEGLENIDFLLEEIENKIAPLALA